MPEATHMKLGDIAEFQEGYVNPQQSKSEYFNGPVKWLRAVDLNNSFVFTTSRTLTQEGYESAGKSAYLFPPDTLAISKSGTIGRLGILKDWMCGNRAVINIRPRPEVADTRFVFYALLADPAQIDILAEGSVQRNLYVSQLSGFSIPLPDLPEQRHIVSLLGALDDKIELNRRMNETLEAMARAIFKDWFVDFGPTRAKAEGRAPYLAPELWNLFPDALDDEGKPVGWQIGKLSGSFRLTMGQSPPGNTYNNDRKGLPFFQGRTDFGFRYPDNRRYCSAPTRIAERDDTLVSVRAPVGDINMAWERCCVGRGVAALRHKSGSRSFTYYSAWAAQQELMQYEQTGTVFGAINKAQFEAISVVESAPEIVSHFESQVGPLDEHIRGNVAESRTLAQTRDFLLPKLMSGEIRLRDPERAQEAVA